MYLISFKNAQFAYTFIDYMASQNIILRAELDQEGHCQLFFDDSSDEKLSIVKRELEQYIKNPYDKRYLDAIWQQTNTHLHQSSTKGSHGTLFNISPVGSITLIITIICIVLYLLLSIFGATQILTYLGYPISGQYAQLWRYITPAIIHFSLLHITFNLMWWWYLGGMIERQRGRFKLIEVFVISGLLSNYAQASISGPDFGGLSGIVYALMGYVWLYGEVSPSSGLRFERTMIFIAVIWLLAGYTGILGPIANTAHLVGLIVGLLLAAKDIWLIKKNE
ncbi:rhomboid family intramembrane serine protease GlpG [Orbus sturtevantii]|uniref:rhomboid family intramembrane serine protease GlpG n=1 Tax=Orbus sturtevantii TaxID=3074109 RepID=UPI00370D6273